MAPLKEIVAYLDDYLAPNDIPDYGPQGLQVEGAAEVTKIITGVSASLALFEEAVRRGAEAVVVHHGLIWDGANQVVTGAHKKRLAILLKHDISLLCYHLCLDRHEEVGNNAQLIKALGLQETGPFGFHKGKPIGFMATTGEPLPVAQFMERVKRAIGPPVGHHPFGKERIEKVAVCSGSAQSYFKEAVEKGADLFITGEESEWVYHLAKEENIHYVAAGHHATERFGARALAEKMNADMEVEVGYVEIENPI